ncbi:MAG: carboxylate--amine ligase [bacterium]
MQTNKHPAVVINLDCVTGLQTSRILATHGVPVIGVANNPEHYCVQTNVCTNKIFVDTKSEALIDRLEDLGPSLSEKAALFPCADTSVLLISKHRERLAKWYHIALPKHEIVAMLMDKMPFIEFAQKEGLPIPQVYFLRSRADAEEAAANLTFPCILKPTLKSKAWEVNSRYKAYKVFDADELLNLYDKYACWTEVLMVQRFVQGADVNHYTCNCYFSDASQPLVTFVSRKLRQWPHTTGTACLSQAWQNDEVLNTTVDLFRRVDYYGLGYLEMKQDAKDGKYYIIEPNIGRPTGRSALAEASGVELLYTQYCDVTGRSLPENREQKYTGVKWIWLRHDLQSSFAYWKRGDLTFLQWLKSIRGKKVDALFSWKDPKPFLGDWSRAIKLALGGGKKEKASQNIEPRQHVQATKQIIHNGKVKKPGVKEEMQGIVK